jgi:integrase
MFNVAIMWKHIPKGGNPVDDVEFLAIQEGPRRILSVEEQERLLAVAPPHLRRIIVFAVNTGCRLGEIVGLKGEDVDLQAAALTISHTKSGRVRVIPINGEVRAVLRESTVNRGGFVFGYNGNRILRSSRSWESALGKARVPHLRFHDLQHTAITRMVLAGRDLATVKEIAGHADISVTMRYSHATPESKVRAMDLLSAHFQNSH